MKYLKEFWDKCGNERFSAKVMLIITTFLTIHIITSFYPPLVNVIVIALNVIMAILYLFGEDDD